MRVPALGRRRRHRLIAEVRDDDGKVLFRAWDDSPAKAPPRPVRADYGPSWQAIRARIIERDGGACRRCGDDFDLHVHHIRPLRLFSGDTEAANQDHNLETLCQPCHQDTHARLRSEGIFE